VSNDDGQNRLKSLCTSI